MYNFQQRLEQCAALTEQTLDLYLPQQEGDHVTEAMRYSLLAGPTASGPSWGRTPRAPTVPSPSWCATSTT